MDVRVSFDSLSCYSILAACIGLPSAFVLSLYAVSAGFPRNHPVTVRRRILVITILCLAAPFYVWSWSSPSDGKGEPLWRVLGIKWDGLLWAVVCPLVLVLAAYTGPIVHCISCGANPFATLTHHRRDIALRNFIVAPFAEEFVFRACLVPFLLPVLGRLGTILLCPLFFGIAHLHHFFEWLRNRATPITYVLLELGLQLGYTSIFGIFSSFLFVRTGHLVSPVLAHTSCNILGLPPLDEIQKHRHPIALFTVYLVGLMTFLLLLFPLTDPMWFS